MTERCSVLARAGAGERSTTATFKEPCRAASCKGLRAAGRRVASHALEIAADEVSTSAPSPESAPSPRAWELPVPATAKAAPRPDYKERDRHRSEEHTSELQSLMRISYAVFCMKKKKSKN